MQSRYLSIIIIFLNPNTTHSIFYFKTSLECECNINGALSNSCTQDGGICTCVGNVTGDKCDACLTGWYDFPSCHSKIYHSSYIIAYINVTF